MTNRQSLLTPNPFHYRAIERNLLVSTDRSTHLLVRFGLDGGVSSARGSLINQTLAMTDSGKFFYEAVWGRYRFVDQQSIHYKEQK